MIELESIIKMSTKGVSLEKYNTFALSMKATRVIITESVDDMITIWRLTKKRNEAFLVLGEGSNLLFTEDFQGTVVINRLKGVTIREESDAWHLHVGAGENWHQLVEQTLNSKLPGLENLALIPGCVGAAPIQNIGAYGVEFKERCEYVDVLNLGKGIVQRLHNEQCEFGYRESIFKHAYKTGYVIVSVGLCLNKQWQPILSYGDLSKHDAKTVTPRQVFETVCNMRCSKLPDPKIMGNAGSFFKNPVVSKATADSLIHKYPEMPQYVQENGDVKLAAGWLIDRCKLKGFRIGDAAVHKNQALVLVNLGNATSKDIVTLARHVCQKVSSEFNIFLQPEVRFIAAHGEINSMDMLA